MGSLVELARIAKSDPYVFEPAPRRRIPGENALMGAGAAVAGAGGLVALRSRNLPEKAALNAQAAMRRANEAQRRSMSSPRSKTAKKTAAAAFRDAEIADFARENAPARAKWMRRFGGKTALAGGAAMAAGYGIKRLNNGS